MSSENGQYCVEESRVVDAARSGSELPHDLAHHAASCPVCSEALIAVTFLQEAQAATGRVEVPAAGLVYWKADLRARRERTEQAMRPMRWVEGASVGILLTTGVTASLWSDWTTALAAVGFCAALGGCWWAMKTLGSARR